MVDHSACLGARAEQVRALLYREQLDAIILRRSANFAWYTDGSESRVDHSSPFGVADMIITRDAHVVLANTIEAGRMRAEQTPEFEVLDYPWYEEPPFTRLAGRRLGTDFDLPQSFDVSGAMSSLRQVLDAAALERYRRIGADTQAACRDAAEQLALGMTEWEMMATLEAACRRRGLYSPVAMAASDVRIEHFRHPVTFGATAQRRVMLVVCAERGGLYANMTAWVHFDEPDAEWRRRQRACESILRRLRQELTMPGRSLADIFFDLQRLYAEEGYGGQWQLHHQGGITGYATREVVATPTSRESVHVGQAFAWNPSITGAKAEETFILGESGPEILASAFSGI